VAGSPEQKPRDPVHHRITEASCRSASRRLGPMKSRSSASGFVRSQRRFAVRNGVERRPAVYLQPPVITALRFSPDGQTLAVSGNREVLLHRADGSGPGETGCRAKPIASCRSLFKRCNLMIAGGGTPARSARSSSGSARGQTAADRRTTNDTVLGASLSPDASKSPSGCADNTCAHFDTPPGAELYKISTHENWVLGTAFGIDSKRLVSVGRDRPPS